MTYGGHMHSIWNGLISLLMSLPSILYFIQLMHQSSRCINFVQFFANRLEPARFALMNQIRRLITGFPSIKLLVLLYNVLAKLAKRYLEVVNV